MKIIQMNVLADSGSTGKIVACVDEELTNKGFQSLVCYGRKQAADKPRRFKFGSEAEAATTKIITRLGGLMYGGSPIATRRLIAKIRSEKPDLVHIHCINGYCINIYRLLTFLAKDKIPTLVTHHAEFLYTGSCGLAFDCDKFTFEQGCIDCPIPKNATGSASKQKAAKAWKKMRDCFALFEKDRLLFTAVSLWVKSRSALSPIVNSFDCVLVENGIDASTFRLMENRREIRKRIPNCSEKMFLHVTASFTDNPGSIKGGNLLIELAHKIPNTTFVVAASYSEVSSPLPDNVYLWGRTKDQKELAALYNAADLTVITSSRETFSMIVAESLCCGTPIAGFVAGGPESIAIEDFSRFVPYGDTEELKNASLKLLSQNFDPKKIAAKALQRYSGKSMAENYIKAYERLLSQIEK